MCRYYPEKKSVQSAVKKISDSRGYVYMALSATGVIFLPTTARLAPQSGIERR
jgi:hypothetical protein